MIEYKFFLRYALSEGDSDIDDIIERLGAAGCTDALVGSGVSGRIALEFAREAASAKDALSSAISDVSDALPSATLIEAGPDVVGITDVAGLVGVSRQYVRTLVIRHLDFPAPVHGGSTPLWRLFDVLPWLATRSSVIANPHLLDVSRATLDVNLARDRARYLNSHD